MALTNNSETSSAQKQQEQKKSVSDYVEIVATWVVDIISIPVSFVSFVLGQFLTPGSSGTRILGALGFFTGTLLSTDSVWQTVFQGTRLFPWFERTWIGWIGWLTLPFNLLFWISLGISALIQIMEARTLRGKRPDQARDEFEASKQYTLGTKPQGNIDLTKALWGDYKRAGMRERHAGGAIALFFWVLDFATTFVSRNPFRYANPGTILACLLYNLTSMMAGEIGFSIWKLTK